MSSDKEQPETSKGGSPIFRHREAAPCSPAAGESSIQQISDHIEAHLGKIDTVFHEIISDSVHLDVHLLKPNATCPYSRIVTSGMSDLPMQTPDGIAVPKYIELMMALPADWRLDQESLKEEAWYWPIRLLKSLARMPHKHQTWLGWGHTVPNGDPATPYSPNTKLCGAIVLPPLSAPEKFFMMPVNEQKLIVFFAIVPLYQEEIDLKLRSGADKLEQEFQKANISDVINLERPNVGAAKTGWRAGINKMSAFFSNKGAADRGVPHSDHPINPDSANSLLARGNAYANKGEYDRAIEDYSQAIRLNPNYVQAFGNRGAAYSRKGEYDRAIQDYDQAIKLKPDSANYWAARGNIYHNKKGEYDRAIQDYTHAIDLSPNSADYIFSRGNSFNKKGECDRAIQDYDQAIKLNPNYAKAFYMRGAAKQTKGDEPGAAADLAKAIELDPKLGQ